MRGLAKTDRRIITIAVLLLALLVPAVGSAGFNSRYWWELGLRYRVNKKLRVGLAQHLRLDNDGGNWENIGTEIFARRKFNKHFAAEGGYRFIVEPLSKNSGVSYHDKWHRLYVGSLSRYRVRRFTFGHRLRYQEQLGSSLQRDVRTLRNLHTIRNQLSVDAKLKKGLHTVISGELFGRIDSDGFLQKWRATAGLDYDYKNHAFGVFYRREGMLNGPNDPITAIIGLGYNFTL